MGNYFKHYSEKLVGVLIMSLTVIFPGATRRALPRILSRAPGEIVLAGALNKTAIESILVRGEQGLFAGAASDISVIQRYALTGEWSTRTTALLIEFFGEGKAGTYFDIGANIGLTSIPVAARGIKVIAFEPVPTNYAFLCTNIVHNGVADCLTAVNVALVEDPGELEFELSPSNHGDHRVRRGQAIAMMAEDGWQTVKVQGRRIDDYVDQIDGPLAIKVDTQGAEPFVISGGTKTFSQAKLVLCEFSPYNMARMGADPSVIIEYFASFPEVSVFECEAENETAKVADGDLRRFLGDYFERNKNTPYGRYLNLIGAR